MNLIVDSGSTKTTWCVAHSPAQTFEVRTAGINPVRDSASQIGDVVSEALALIASQLGAEAAPSAASGVHFRAVRFYGAGCLPDYVAPVVGALAAAFCGAEVTVESDLLGAARALCGRQEGIACILGTGANSCLYDGCGIRQQTPALGWILGDEGSGAVLGRRLVGDVLKGQLPAALCAAFFERYGLSQADIIGRVYRSPQPNRFLASLVPFLAEHVEEAAVRAFLTDEFRRFLRRNVLAYGRPDLAVSFVGGVAAQFAAQLVEAVEAEGLRPGQILRDPVAGMVAYHAADFRA